MKLNLLETALLLGGIAFLAGCYGLLYGVGRLAQRQSIMLAGFACYAFLCMLVAVIVSTTPLAGPWKAIVVVFALGFLGIPPVTWRFLERTHPHRRRS